jgi:RNA polymerase sigma-70 factor (ECF subfamily)
MYLFLCSKNMNHATRICRNKQNRSWHREREMPYSPCINRIRKIPSAMRLPPDDVDDITQQTLVECLAYAGTERHPPTSQIEGTITRRRCSDHFRTRARNQRRFPGGNDISNALAPEADPAKEAEQRDNNEFIRKAVASLPTRYREILRLVYWEGLSDAQIAIQLGCSEGCIRQLKRRARNRVKPRLNSLA